jgi:hypothetical protein
MAYLLLYVDDIILTASSITLLNHLINQLWSEFAMTDLGSLQHFLGVSVQRTNAGLFLSQAQYATDILTRANMLHCYPCLTPIDTKTKLSVSDGTPLVNPTEYQQACLFMHSPTDQHLHLVKRIFRYIKGTLYHGLRIARSRSTDVIVYFDTDWARCPDTPRLTSGYCAYLSGNLISWSSKRQHTVSLSSAEAKYRGVANAVTKSCWVQQSLDELGHSPRWSTIVFCDNIGTSYMSSNNPVHHQQTKHIKIDLHFVREKASLGEVKVLHVPYLLDNLQIYSPRDSLQHYLKIFDTA